jgi:hypothetical protein
MNSSLYALLAEFKESEQLLAAVKTARSAGFQVMEGYTPFPVDGLPEALGHRPSPIGWFTFGCGMMGVISAYLLQLYSSAISYPVNVGGRPLNSWPAFVPVCFELGVLFAAAGAVLSMFFFNRLPLPYHPIFNAKEFDLATRNRFFFAIEKKDPLFDVMETKKFLTSLNPERVIEVYQ